MSMHTIAALCKRGHVISLDAGVASTELGYCDQCGQQVINACRSCSEPILGPEAVADAWGNLDSEGWRRPEFCHKCGSAFPWVDRQGRIYQLENLLAEEGLDEPTTLVVREQLEALANPDLSAEEQKERWQRVKRAAPGLWQRGQNIIEGLVAAAIRQQIGL